MVVSFNNLRLGNWVSMAFIKRNINKKNDKKLFQQLIIHLKFLKMKTKTLLSVIMAWMFVISSVAQNQQIPNGGFETWHTQGQGEDPNSWGSLFNQFNSSYVLVSKSTDVNSGANALKLVCDTGTVQPPLGTGTPGATIYGSLMLGLTNAQVSNAKLPFNSEPDSLVGFIKSTVIEGGFYMNMKLFKNGAQIASATYITVSSIPNYSRFSVPVVYTQSVIPDTITFSIIAAHPGINPSAHPDNEFFIDDLTLIYNSTGTNDVITDLNISIYPNPILDLINVENNNDDKLFFKIFDIIGKEVINKELFHGKNTLFVENLSSGLYFYHIANFTGKILKSDKFLKQ